MNLFIAVTTLIGLPLFLNNAPPQLMEKQAIANTQRTLASDLDAELPKLPFTDWFGNVVGPKAGVIWQLSECGDQINAAPNGDGDIRACVEVNSVLPDGRKVIVMIAVGTFKKGMTGPPTFRFGVIAQDKQLRQVKRLRDLEGLLSRPGNPHESESLAAKLPEVTITFSKLTWNNASYTKTPPWTAEDFSLLLSIKDPPPPPEPRQASLGSTEEESASPQGLKILGEVTWGGVITKVQPRYPMGAKKLRLKGKIDVRVSISVTGKVTAAKAANGPLILRAAAEEAAMQWVFKPSTLKGAPVETEIVLTFEFKAPE